MVASFVVQDIQSEGVSAAVLTFIANSLFAVYLPIYWVNLRLRERAAAKRRASSEEAALVPAGSTPSDAMVQPLAAQSSKDLPDMTWRQLLRSALLVRESSGQRRSAVALNRKCC
mgnify:CR=1 FL=1